MEHLNYDPKIYAKDIDFEQPDEIKALKTTIAEYGLTHVKDRQGRVWKITGDLNKKSVPLETTDEGPSRINFSSVHSFGISWDGTPTEYPQNIEAGGTETATKAAEKVEEESPQSEPEERAHAVLSASGAHRWLNCPPSATLEENLAESTSTAAEEGTAAHALGEHKIRKGLDQRSQRPVSKYNDDDMEDYTDAYADYVLTRWRQAQAEDSSSLIFLEQRLDFSETVPEGFGTGDCLIAHGDTLTVIDFKYGAGVLVDSWDNPQMKLYALGALKAFDFIFDFTTIEMVIYQPRRDNISMFSMSVPDLLDWAENTVAPIAKLAAAGEGEFKAGEWCQFCKIKATCRQRAEENLVIAKFEFADATELSDEEIAEVLMLAPKVKAWIADVERFTTDQAVGNGRVWPGFKLVAGRSARKYTDPDAVATAAATAGYTDIYDRKLISLSKMEKLMGKNTFNEVLGGLVHKAEGKPTLVPVADHRPEIASHSAADDFADVA
ncbi:hypothetical protein CULC809_01176 [Corynebacterium ulcerans 809]|uniref:DUF2800 domain-containing protein n=1 Tax=Corynebacterium ulcerans TaxID=65058 RepID=UPI0002185494|nr:DUF2800 domain-containing protein [Corynebacterium ulcerans]AEG81709.1 hypothetical protein CULC809_01176 [Corynebacterium ulcerans 809]